MNDIHATASRRTRSRRLFLWSGLCLTLIAFLVDALLNRSVPALEDSAQTAELAAQGDMDASAAEVRLYAAFVRQHAAEIGVERLATSDALIGLTRAIGKLAGPEGFSETEARVAFLDLSSRGRVLAQSSPDDLTYADIVREAFVRAAGLLRIVQARVRPHDAALAARVSQLDAVARSIRTDEPLADQRADVLRFFHEASHIVQALTLATSAIPQDASGTA